MLRERRGDRVPSPGAVVFPPTAEDVSTVLAWASQTGTPVVPRGGGSGLGGEEEAVAWSLVIDTSRLDRVVELDDVSQIVRVEAGLRGGLLEAGLNRLGFSTGLEMPSFEASTVGGWVAGAAAGELFSGFGDIAGRVIGLSVALADGAIMRLESSPPGTPGLDLTRLLVGS